MDIYQLIFQNNLNSQIENFINGIDSENVATLLYFYSTVAQSMAALFTVSIFFAVYRLQAIDAQLSRSYTSYREWINIRLSILVNTVPVDQNAVQQLLAKQGLELWGLGVDLEPNSWLEKDIIDHAKGLFRAAQKHESTVFKALRDYYRHFCTQGRLRIFIKYFSIIPLGAIGLLLLDVLTQLSYLHFQKNFNKSFYIQDLTTILIWTKWLLIYFFFYALIAIFGIPEINDNNLITNGPSYKPTLLKRMLNKLCNYFI